VFASAAALMEDKKAEKNLSGEENESVRRALNESPQEQV
jgi:hypothetical protein